MLELGCGTARDSVEPLREHPNWTYVGVEPNQRSFSEARTNIGNLPNVTLYHQLGYGSIGAEAEGSFDIAFSLSALEHVKHLKKFIDMGSRYVKPGGLVVHRYDLGHALFSKSLKERFQVFLGNTFPSLLPEHKFVRYVPLSEVEACMRDSGCEVNGVTYHDMVGHYGFERLAKGDAELERAAERLYAWEHEHAGTIARIPLSDRERLFPAIAVWGRKAP